MVYDTNNAHIYRQFVCIKGSFLRVEVGGGRGAPVGHQVPPQLPVTTKMHSLKYIYIHSAKKGRIEFMARSLS